MPTTLDDQKIRNAVSTLARERIDAGDYDDPRTYPDILDIAVDRMFAKTVGATTGRDTPRAERRR